MTTKQRYKAVIEWFEQNVPVAETELQYRTPFELLVAVILSAQCTDKRINMVTPALFEAYPTAEAMAKASPEDIFEYIKSVTFPNNKSRSLVGMANALVDRYGGEVPSTLEELTKIPGVGRKTANVILSVVFHKSAMAAYRQFSQSACHRTHACGKHSRAIGWQGSSLVDTARAVCVHGAQAQVPRMWPAPVLQVLQRNGSTR